ncbi:MAG: TorF family putative porin [Steroidobacteraceae bacterium]
MTVSHPGKPAIRALCALALLALAGAPERAPCQEDSSAVGGNLALTSDYIYHGVSESDGRGALQADLHASTAGGLFAGLWASTRDRNLEPGAAGEVQLYVGQRVALDADWTATLSGRADHLLGGSQQAADDYQEIAAAFSWLDLWTFSLTAIPSAARYGTYQPPGQETYVYHRVGRSAAFVADSSAQWLITGALYATAGVGYYYASARDAEGLNACGYAYGNAGLAYEWHRWRIDVGYFVVQPAANQLFPYPLANHRLAGTLSWQF